VEQASAGHRSPHAELHTALGRLLRERGYGGTELSHVLGVAPEHALDPDARPLASRRAREDGSELATLAALLLLGEPQPVDRVGAALAPLEHDRLVEAGVLARGPDGIRAELRILPYEGLLLASDPPDARAGREEEVTAPGPSARTLAALTVRRRVRSALDLGSGGGVQGLLLARHADRVVLTDVSPRARTVAALNAALNAIDNVELRTGDWFDPVEGERFDLVAANLPYVVSPDVAYVHRDNPLERDSLSRWVVERVGGHLTDGGFAHVLCSWVHGEGEEWARVPLGWVAETGCDALVLHYASHEPLEYAVSWNRPLQRADPEAFEATVDRWLAYYAEEGIEGIASGAIVLRRRASGRPWHRPVEVPDAPTGLAGAHVQRLFAAQDELARLPGPEALLSERLRPVPGERLDQAMLYRDGAYAPDAALMRRHPGVGVVARVDPRVMPVVVGCDGSRALGELIDAATQRLSGRDRVELATLCFATVRTAFELGLLERAGGRR
jgi:methylase of polypeptide subunit release factors